MHTWAEGDPRARLMARKRRAILAAALSAFLDEGYAGSSVNRIATAAGVSIATLYRHFENKDELFVAVVRQACDASAGAADPPWLSLPPLEGLAEAGRELLRAQLAPDALALLRMVARESPRFPELGARYREQVMGHRVALFTRYVDRWPPGLRERITDTERAAAVFTALLEAGWVRTALLAGPVPGAGAVRAHARRTAADLLALVEAGRL